MDHEDMRLRTLEIARAENLTGDALTDRARLLYEIARYGEDEARRLLKERDLDRDRGQRRARPIARAVGKNGDIEQPFRDYLHSDE